MQTAPRRIWLLGLLLLLHLALLLTLRPARVPGASSGPRHELIVWQPVRPMLSPKTPTPPLASPARPATRSAPLPHSLARPTVQAARQPAQPTPPTPDVPAEAATAPAVAQSPEAAPATPAPAAAPALDRSALLAAIRNNEKNRSKDPLEALHQSEHVNRGVETAVAKGAKEGARKNCQTDYGGYGLFAVIPVLYGTVTDKGCKWK
jgi:hypothetical protein